MSPPHNIIQIHRFDPIPPQHGLNLWPAWPQLGSQLATWTDGLNMGDLPGPIQNLQTRVFQWYSHVFWPMFCPTCTAVAPTQCSTQVGPKSACVRPTCYHTPKLLKAAPHPQAVAFHIIGVLRQVAPANRIWKTITRMRRDILKGVKNALKLLTPTTRSSTRMTKEFHGCDRAAPSQLP